MQYKAVIKFNHVNPENPPSKVSVIFDDCEVLGFHFAEPFEIGENDIYDIRGTILIARKSSVEVRTNTEPEKTPIIGFIEKSIEEKK